MFFGWKRGGAGRVGADLRARLERHHAFESYQLRNQHELIAVAYTQWLLLRYELPHDLHFDEEGEMQSLMDFIARCNASMAE